MINLRSISLFGFATFQLIQQLFSCHQLLCLYTCARDHRVSTLDRLDTYRDQPRAQPVGTAYQEPLPLSCFTERTPCHFAKKQARRVWWRRGGAARAGRPGAVRAPPRRRRRRAAARCMHTHAKHQPRQIFCDPGLVITSTRRARCLRRGWPPAGRSVRAVGSCVHNAGGDHARSGSDGRARCLPMERYGRRLPTPVH